LIKLGEIQTSKDNVRKRDIDKGIESLAYNIKALGLLQPITVYQNKESQKYVIIAGQRRFNAHHWLNDNYPGEKFPKNLPGQIEQLPDEIKCIVIPEPETKSMKRAISVAENVTHLHMAKIDSSKAITDLWNDYHDYDEMKRVYGLTRHMVDKFVALARLPQEIKDEINQGGIHSNAKTAENCALRAVDALGWVKGKEEPSIQNVLDMAKEFASNEIEADALSEEARKGGDVKDIADRAKKKARTKFTLNISKEIAEKLAKVSDHVGEEPKRRAIGYVNDGTNRDYNELDDDSD